MKLGERIKQRRKEKGISAEKMAKQLGVSISTVYRYENSSIEKIPVHIFEEMCHILDTTTMEMMGNIMTDTKELPTNFKNAQEAMEFILKMPTLSAFGGYHPENMSEETIVEFANEILQQLKLVSYKYKNIEKK